MCVHVGSIVDVVNALAVRARPQFARASFQADLSTPANISSQFLVRALSSERHSPLACFINVARPAPEHLRRETRDARE